MAYGESGVGGVNAGAVDEPRRGECRKGSTEEFDTDADPAVEVVESTRGAGEAVDALEGALFEGILGTVCANRDWREGMSGTL